MSININVIGTIATPPKMLSSSGQVPFASFRLACNERRYDSESGTWIESETQWFTVSAFRSLAVNAMRSFRRGDRIMVSGKMRIRDWEKEERSGTTVELLADAFGHDIRFGTTEYTKNEPKNRESEVPANNPGESTTSTPSEPAPDPGLANETKDQATLAA